MISGAKAPNFSLVYKNCSRICNPHHLNDKENLCLMQNADKKQKKRPVSHTLMTLSLKASGLENRSSPINAAVQNNFSAIYQKELPLLLTFFDYALASEPAFFFNSSLPEVTTMITPSSIRRIATIS